MDRAGIYISFRFAVDFHHSDKTVISGEEDFAEDVRMIREIITVLNETVEKDVEVCATWTFEHRFSLETVILNDYPDIIEDIKKRVSDNRDEVELMSYNGGLISAHTACEFEDTVSRAISNSAGSGIADLFGEYEPAVRPQEMMYTPVHLRLYSRCGIRTISLFYSSLPFNAFSNFVPPLSTLERYNPLHIEYPGIPDKMILLPSFHVGDLIDNISLSRWVKRLRKQQKKLENPTDLLLLIDLDACDDFRAGLNVPLIKRFHPSSGGLKGLIDSVRDLDYVTFTTPRKYLKKHPPAGTVVLKQDTANGSFDGLSNWAEKRSSQKLWTGIERSRILELQTRALMGCPEPDQKDLESLLAEAYEQRIQSLSTRHFGLSSPVVNTARLKIAADLVKTSVEKASTAFSFATDRYPKKPASPDQLILMNYKKGMDSNSVKLESSPFKGLIRIELDRSVDDVQLVGGTSGEERPVPVSVIDTPGKEQSGTKEMLFVESFDASEEKQFQLHLMSTQAATSERDEKEGSSGTIANDQLSIEFDEDNQVCDLRFEGEDEWKNITFNSAVTYNKRTVESLSWKETAVSQAGDDRIRVKRMSTGLQLDGSKDDKVEITRQFLLAPGLPYLFTDVYVEYPTTPSYKYNRDRSSRLDQAWDSRWSEVMPFEIKPYLFGDRHNPLKIWKHNFAGHVSYYELNYAYFSKNRELDSFNNHITHGWVAVSDGEKGILIAQASSIQGSMAFCPMRLKRCGSQLEIHMNPFGSYYGRQWHYGTAHTGLGKLSAFMTSCHLDPLAPSYNGTKQRFSLMIAPYNGDEPPREIRNDALAFAYPPIVLSNSDRIVKPCHLSWDFDE